MLKKIKTNLAQLIHIVWPANSWPPSFVSQPIWSSALKFLVPSILTIFMVYFYFFINNILTVHWGAQNLNIDEQSLGIDAKQLLIVAVNYSAGVIQLVAVLVMFVIVGAASYFSFLLGRQQKKQAILVYQNNFIFGLAISIIVAIVFNWAAPTWLDTYSSNRVVTNSTAAIREEIKQSWQYARFIIYGLPFFFIAQYISFFLRTERKNFRALLIFILPFGLNIGLDYAFFFKSHLDALGSSLSLFITFIAEVVLAVLFIGFNKESFIAWQRWKDFRFSLMSNFLAVSNGLSVLIRSAMFAILTVEANRWLGIIETGWYSSQEVEKIRSIMRDFAAANTVVLLFTPTMYGLLLGVMPMSSYFAGAERFHQLKSLIRWLTLYGAIFGIGVYAIITFAAGPSLLTTLGVKADDLDSTMHVLQITSLTYVLFTFAMPVFCYFQSCQKFWWLYLVAVWQYVLILSVFVFSTIATKTHNIDWFWAGYPIGTIVLAGGMWLMQSYFWVNMDLKSKPVREVTLAIKEAYRRY